MTYINYNEDDNFCIYCGKALVERVACQRFNAKTGEKEVVAMIKECPGTKKRHGFGGHGKFLHAQRKIHLLQIENKNG